MLSLSQTILTCWGSCRISQRVTKWFHPMRTMKICHHWDDSSWWGLQIWMCVPGSNFESFACFSQCIRLICVNSRLCVGFWITCLCRRIRGEQAGPITAQQQQITHRARIYFHIGWECELMNYSQQFAKLKIVGNIESPKTKTVPVYCNSDLSWHYASSFCLLIKKMFKNSRGSNVSPDGDKKWFLFLETPKSSNKVVWMSEFSL